MEGHNMARIAKRWPLFLAIGYMWTLFAVPGNARAENAQAAIGCNVATLNATYTFSYEGYMGTGQTITRFAVAGLEVYNGKGTIVGISSRTIEGQAPAQFITFTGTYKVNSDCVESEINIDQSGAVTHFSNFFGPEANTLKFIQTDSNVVASGFQTRQPARR